VVPITIETDMARVQSITIIAEGNPAPLSAKFDLGPNVRPYVSTRIKMGQTSNIIAVVQADGRVYSARKEVKVTVGGCDA
jgi:sulfur-oxidizing protein SoxY